MEFLFFCFVPAVRMSELSLENPAEVLHIFKSCPVGSLGNIIPLCLVRVYASQSGIPYGDGSYEYYVNEKCVDNATKGVAPFILAALELDK